MTLFKFLTLTETIHDLAKRLLSTFIRSLSEIRTFTFAIEEGKWGRNFSKCNLLFQFSFNPISLLQAGL